MTELEMRVDRIEEGYAVCYLPEGGMTDILLPDAIVDRVEDGSFILVKYENDAVISVELLNKEDPKSSDRRDLLDKLFGRD